MFLIDPGIAQKIASEDLGRLLENVVFLEMKRRGSEMFYFDQEGECDFVVKDEKGDLSPFQVTWELNDNNRQREIDGLVKACSYFGKKEGQLLTYDEEGEIKKDRINIQMTPVWKWLLQKNSEPVNPVL